MTVIQLLIIAFALFAISRTVLRLRDGSVALGWGVFWLVFWGAVTVVTVLPQTASAFAALLGVGRGADAVMYLALVVLYYVVFRIFVRLEKIEHDITRLVRDRALSDLPEKEDHR